MATKKISFTPNLDSRVSAYAAAHQDMGYNEAVRELVTMGLSVSPVDDLLMASKQRAFDQVRRWAMTELGKKIEELAVTAREQIGDFRREKKT